MRFKQFSGRAGRLKAGEDREEIEALQLGAVQLLAPSTAKLVPWFPEYQVFDLPYLFADQEHVITPPVGLNLYVASGITGRGLYEVMAASLPWMLVLVAALAIVTYVPELSLAFPRWLYGVRY